MLDEVKEAFEACCNKGSCYMTSDTQLDRFLVLCREYGVMEGEEEEIVRRAWKNCTAFKKEGEGRVAYDDLYKEMVAMVEREDPDDQYAACSRELKSGVTDLASLVGGWKFGEGREEDLGKVVDRLASIYKQLDHATSIVERRAREAKLIALLQSPENLVLKKVKDIQIDSGRQFFDFRRENSREIEKKLKSLDQGKNPVYHDAILRCVREKKVSKDTYGHAAGHVHGVVSTVLNRSGAPPVEVVAVPKGGGGVPYEALTSFYNTYTAHQELTVSKYFPGSLGIDDSNPSSDYTLFLYEYYKGRSIADLLTSTGIQLTESVPLFKFWARELLCALNDLQTMSSFLLDPIDLNNVIVAESGTRLLLGKLKFINSVGSQDSVKAVEALRDRSKMLVSCYGNMLRGMICKGKIKEQGGEYDETDAKRVIHVEKGEIFAIVFNTQQSDAIVIDRPKIISANSSLHPPVVCLNKEEPLQAQQDGNYRLLFRGKGVGHCSIQLFYRLRHEKASAVPSIVYQVEVNHSTASPTLQAIVKASQSNFRISLDEDEVDEEIIENKFQPTLSQLLSHPYFTVHDSTFFDLSSITDSYESIFGAT